MKYALIISLLISAMFALLFTGCSGFRVGSNILIEYGEVSNTHMSINSKDKDENEITNINAPVSPNAGW